MVAPDWFRLLSQNARIVASYPIAAVHQLVTHVERRLTSRDSTARQTWHTERGRRELTVSPATVAIAC